MVDLRVASKKVCGDLRRGENLENIGEVRGRNLQTHVGFIDQAKPSIDRRVQLFKANFPHNMFDGNR